ARATDRDAGATLVATLRGCIGEAPEPMAPQVLAALGTREVEEQIWSTIAHLAHGEFIQKSNGDGVTSNRGKHGGAAAKAAGVHVHARRDLEELGDHLHERYRALFAAAGMSGKAEVVDHVFRWETDFAFPWMEGWAANQAGPAERNIVVMIPGKRRDQAVVMGDHYDTAYMEDCYYAESGGDLLRAPAAGADDNHSATTALLLAAERLLPLAKAGKLERDVWLVHLTGEEYPADCMGARALCQALVERRLAFTAEDGSPRDVSGVTVVGAFVLDMVGHNTERDRDVFQIAPGEGTGSAKLAHRAHRANLAWNALATRWNEQRAGLHRARRMPDDPKHHAHPVPPPFAHLALHGEVRVEWEPRSALFNTDGQIFSDLGIPVVLFMENYDISRKGYHDTHDTMANIDLDYCTAMIAIAIETVADTACAPSL
ncbi:MAG: M28 family peptidase, partial [Kofleriaceae bacterium]